MQTLDVQLIFAYSPQAKGRVERNHGTLQDRQSDLPKIIFTFYVVGFRLRRTKRW